MFKSKAQTLSTSNLIILGAAVLVHTSIIESIVELKSNFSMFINPNSQIPHSAHAPINQDNTSNPEKSRFSGLYLMTLSQ